MKASSSLLLTDFIFCCYQMIRVLIKLDPERLMEPILSRVVKNLVRLLCMLSAFSC